MKTKYKFIVLVLLAIISSIAIYQLVEKVKPVEQTDYLLNTQIELEEEFIKDTNYSFDNPKVILDPYNISPLSALIIFETKDLTNPTITISGKDSNTTYTKTFKSNKTHILPIYGLYPDSDNKITIKVSNKTHTLNIKTNPLPEDIIIPTTFTNNNNNELYFIISENNYPVAYDSNGDIRWYLKEPFTWNIKRLNNGHIMMGSNRLKENNNSIGLVELDLLGRIYYEYIIPDGFHNDFYELPDGNILALTNNNEKNTINDYVVEIDRETGNITRKIDLSKIIHYKNNTNQTNWFDNTSISYDETNNSILLSSKTKNAIINIDYDTLDINWIAGDNTEWDSDSQKYFLKPNNDLFKNPTYVSILPDNNILVLDNNTNNRATIYNYDLENMTIKQIWQYNKSSSTSEKSNASYIKDNHYLIHFGNKTIEVLNNKEVFKLELPIDNYKTIKMNLYSNDEFSIIDRIKLGTLNKSETIKNKLLLFNKNYDTVKNEYNIKLFKEIDRLIIKGNFKKTDNVEIILDNIFFNKTYAFNTSENIKYINNNGLSGKYYIFIKINNTTYDFDQYIEF